MAHMGKPTLNLGPALLSALFLTCGISACSTSTASTGTSTDTPDALATSLADSFCAAQAACCGTTGVTTDDGGAAVPCGSGGGDAGAAGGAMSTCQARAALAANEQLALISTAFNEGLLTINPTVATTCAAAYQTTLVCPTLAGQSVPDVQMALDAPGCAGIFTGYIPVGERCDMTAECISGSFCLSQGTGQPVTSIAGSGTLGICFAYQLAGDACNTTDDCLPPLTCNPTTLLCQ
jgi:hypothetical protein